MVETNIKFTFTTVIMCDFVICIYFQPCACAHSENCKGEGGCTALLQTQKALSGTNQSGEGLFRPPPHTHNIGVRPPQTGLRLWSYGSSAAHMLEHLRARVPAAMQI